MWRLKLRSFHQLKSQSTVKKPCLNLQFVLKSVAQPSQPFQHPESTLSYSAPSSISRTPCDDLFPFFGVSSPHETWAETTETWDFCIFFVTCIGASPRSLSRNRSWKAAIHCCTQPPKALCESHWFAHFFPGPSPCLPGLRPAPGQRRGLRMLRAAVRGLRLRGGAAADPIHTRLFGCPEDHRWGHTHRGAMAARAARADGDGIWRCLEWIWGFKNDLNVCNVCKCVDGMGPCLTKPNGEFVWVGLQRWFECNWTVIHHMKDDWMAWGGACMFWIWNLSNNNLGISVGDVNKMMLNYDICSTVAKSLSTSVIIWIRH